MRLFNIKTSLRLLSPLLFIVHLLFTVPTFAEPTLNLSNGNGPIDSLIVGDDLWLSIEGAAPWEVFNIAMKDESGTVIRCQSIHTDADGKSPNTLFWQLTGVRGRWATSHPAPYRFWSFEEAEQLLDGRNFTLELKSLNNCLTTVIPLPLKEEDPPQLRLYIADAFGGLLMNRMAGESLYLATENLPNDWVEMRIFVIDPNAATATTSTSWADLRPQFPYGQVVSLSTPDPLSLIWLNPGTQDFKVVVRGSSGPTNPIPTSIPSDLELESPHIELVPDIERVPEDPEECLECIE